jgi:hypothetical protein
VAASYSGHLSLPLPSPSPSATSPSLLPTPFAAPPFPLRSPPTGSGEHRRGERRGCDCGRGRGNGAADLAARSWWPGVERGGKRGGRTVDLDGGGGDLEDQHQWRRDLDGGIQSSLGGSQRGLPPRFSPPSLSPSALDPVAVVLVVGGGGAGGASGDGGGGGGGSGVGGGGGRCWWLAAAAWGQAADRGARCPGDFFLF